LLSAREGREEIVKLPPTPTLPVVEIVPAVKEAVVIPTPTLRLP